MPATLTAGGYSASYEGHVMTVHDVPIFVECERHDIVFDRDWIEKAVERAMQAESEGYLAPLHIRHHEAATEANDSVKAAGFFRITGTKHITFKGSSKLAVMADLIITDPAVQDEIMAVRLPYRSVEIFNVEKPAIDGLALLDHEAPFLELPMLRINNVRERSEAVDDGVAGATFRHDWSFESAGSGGSLAASFKRGSRIDLLFREKPMAEELKKDDDEGDEKGINMEEGAEGEVPEAEEAAPPTMDIASIVQAIQDGSISVADMDAICAAVEARKGMADQQQPQAQVPGQMPAMAPAPGAETMSKKVTTESAQMAGENVALKARLDEIESKERRREDVAAAMKRLAGRPLGSKLEEELLKFHKDHGPAAFKPFVEAIDKASPPVKDSANKAADFAGQSSTVPAIALNYQKDGVDAVERASTFAAEWTQLHESGFTRMSQERYVAVNMAKQLTRN